MHTLTQLPDDIKIIRQDAVTTVLDYHGYEILISTNDPRPYVKAVRRSVFDLGQARDLIDRLAAAPAPTPGAVRVTVFSTTGAKSGYTSHTLRTREARSEGRL